MPRTRSITGSTLQSRIETLAAAFAREVVGALRSVPLSEIATLSGEVVKRGPGRPPKVAAVEVVKAKRRVVNYPKCRWPDGCGKNMSPRTRPLCGEHWRARKAAEIAAGVAPPAKKRGRKKGA